MRNDRFHRGRGGQTYHCAACKRLTRHTGAQSLGSPLCPQCYELAGIENEISDGFATLAEWQATIDGYLAELVAKGGDVREWRQAFKVEVSSEA